MKTVLSFILASCLFFCLCPAAFAEGESNDTLADWNIRIAVPENAVAVLHGSEYYLYAQQEGSIPYVMLRTYRADDAAAFFDEFTAYMRRQYPDLKITAEAHSVTLGEKNCLETDYSYQVSGYDVRDRRIVIIADGTAYLFTSKEIDELGMTVGSMLDDVVANCQFVSDSRAEQDLGLSDGYLYCDGNGIPEYWLDFSRIVDDNLVLHCWFQSGDAVFRESCYVLDLSSAEAADDGMRFRQIRSLQDGDAAGLPENLTIRFYLDGAVMIAEQTQYVMVPVGVTAGPGEKQSHFRPTEDGPYQPEELEIWARFYYFRSTGRFLPETEIIALPDGTYTIILYEAAGSDGNGQAESVRYTVDAYGEGKNDRTGESVSLMR
jgi:hypothetical protein